MKDKQHITIHIAEAILPMDIPPEKEEMLRKVEKDVNSLYAYWRKTFKDGYTSTQVLAMVAFRFAELYYSQLSRMQSNAEALEKAEQALDKILLDVK